MELRLVKIGNSYCVRIPREIATRFIGKGVIEVSFGEIGEVEKEKPVYTRERPSFGTEMCKKHKGSYTYSCGCA